jgi:hypothetical protein
METTELKKLIDQKKADLITTATEFLNSSIQWVEDDINPDNYMVEVVQSEMAEDEILINFVMCDEYFNGTRNTDFGEWINISDIKDELLSNAKIFEPK